MPSVGIASRFLTATAGGGLKRLPDESAALPAMRQGDDKMQSLTPSDWPWARLIDATLEDGDWNQFVVGQSRANLRDVADVRFVPICTPTL